MSSLHHFHCLLLLLAAAVSLLSLSASSAGQFTTLAISHVSNVTLVCALVLPTSPEPSAAAYGGNDAVPAYKLNCTSLPDGKVLVYPSTDIPYSAIVAGDDFLCGLMSPAGGHAAMRWWSFSDEEAANHSHPVGKRLYWGPSLRGLAAGGSHVCGISDFHEPTCWEWPELSLPRGLNFTVIALGADFLCGIVAPPDGGIRCFGDDTSIVGREPPGRYRAIEAGWHHVCAVTTEGSLACWGDGMPEIGDGELPRDMTAMALGDNFTCILSGNGTVRCWGAEAARPPPQYAAAQFVAIEAQGDAVCGVLFVNYAVVCWGSGDFLGNHQVYSQSMPGACAPRGKCPCDVLPGSANLCGGGDYAVCQPCRLPLAAAKISIGGKNTTAGAGAGAGGKNRVVMVVLGVAGVAVGVLAAVGLACYLIVYKKLDRKVHVTVRLGESSSRRLCRDIEASMAVALPPPQQAPPVTRALGCEEFPLKELVRVTDGFAEERKVGSGSFGSVYRAQLADGREVAVKRAERKASSRGRRHRRRCEAERAFRSELKLLSRVNHRNLVQLLGFCEERGERILVFEFLPHGALHDHLHRGGRDAASPLFASWHARLRVALDAARGVEYLHCYAVPPVIHRDIKPSNILLDAEWTAKVSDFGLSLASVGGGAACAAASAASATAGTLGYMDPEYYRLQELTERSDVYSFGVVLLELLTGRKAIHRGSQDGSGSPRNLVEFAVPAVEAGDTTKVLDDRVLPPRGPESEAVARVAKIAAECVRARGRARPVMTDVVAELEYAVCLCEEAIAASGRDQHGSDMSRSRSDSGDFSPFHTREFGLGSGQLGRSDSRG